MPSTGDEDLELFRANWAEVVGFNDIEQFVNRFRWSGLSESQLLHVLDPALESIPEDQGWLKRLAHMQSIFTNRTWCSESLPSSMILPFEDVWHPIVAMALTELKEKSYEWNLSIIADSAWLDLRRSLLERLCTISEQVLWEMFNRRRTPGQMLAAHIASRKSPSGKHSDVVYKSFVADVHDSHLNLIFNEYPVLGRLVATLVDLWLIRSEELLQRITTNIHSLYEKFAISAGSTLTSIDQGKGDFHCGGASVAILGFTHPVTNESTRVVYKPKDIRLDICYQNFLSHVNFIGAEAQNLPPLRVLKVMGSGDYGFIEFLPHKTCESDDMLRMFYWNAGRLLAILYLLGCSDCHHENLIANADQLILIDSETLFEADPYAATDVEPTEDHLVDLDISASVLRTGLLPNWQMYPNQRNIPLDGSALGIDVPPQEISVTTWLFVNTDGMINGRQKIPSPLPTSLPVGMGGRNRLRDFSSEVVSGFHEQLSLFTHFREPFLQALNGFSGLYRRYVPRPTNVYFKIQRQLLSPSSLRTSVAQGLILEQLGRKYLLAKHQPFNWPMFDSEVRQMERLDIPFFLNEVDGHDLLLEVDLGQLQGFMRTSGLDASRQRLIGLNTPDIGFQKKLIEGSIAARFGSARSKPFAEPAFSQAGVSNCHTTEEANRIAERLWHQRLEPKQGGPSWLGFELLGTSSETYRFGLIGSSLYSGTSGIAVMFLQLGQSYSQIGNSALAAQWLQRADEMLSGALEPFRTRTLPQVKRLLRDMHLGLNGVGGLILALQLVGSRKAEIDDLLDYISLERIAQDKAFDLLFGVTGLIGPLLRHGSTRAYDLARHCAEHLLAHQNVDGGWLLPTQGPSAMTGLSHGTAGMAVALAKVASLEPNNRFADAARRALAFERMAFSPGHNNWSFYGPDGSGPTRFGMSWCHGAPGIVLARLALTGTVCCDEQIHEDIDAGLQATILSLAGFSADKYPDHLCCGLYGLTSIIRIAAQMGLPAAQLALPKVRSIETKRVELAAQRGGRYNYNSVADGTIDMPGLFTGSAGVALALLESTEKMLFMPTLLTCSLMQEP